MSKTASIPEYMIDMSKIVVSVQIDLLKNVVKELELSDEKFNELRDKFVDESTSKMKVKKDKNAPKKPKTSYMFFCQEKRAEVQKKHPGKSMGDTSKILGEMWSKLSEKEKAKYVKMNEQAKEEYEEEMKEYGNK